MKPDLLFAGTEFGLFFTLDGGVKWIQVKSGLPTIAVRDLEIQRRESDLAIGTFGRGFYILDDYSPLRELTDELLEKPAHIFPVKKAWMYIQTSPLGSGGKAFQGASFFTAPNPPFGATFTYYMKESLKTKKSVRQEKDRSLERQGKDVPYPSWEELKTEDREESPETFLTIFDSAGQQVREIPVAPQQGIHQATWDFRYPGYAPLQLSGDGYGPLAVPGNYTVSLSTRIDGKVTQLVGPTPFQVEVLGTSSLPEGDRQATLAFQQKTGDLQRAVMGAYRVAQETAKDLKYVQHAVEVTPGIDPALGVQVRQLQQRLQDLLERFSGDPTKPRRNEPGMPGILDRLQTIVYGSWSTSQAPTATQRKSYDIVADQFSALLGDLTKLVEKDVPALGRKLDAAGVPWTPGRGIPRWQRDK